jgi:transposase
MPGTKVLMRKVREVLRLKHALGMSERLIADAVGVGKTAVGEHLRRCRVIGLGWPLPDGMDDAELERRLFTPAGFHDGPTRQLPDCPKVHEELKRRGVTLMLLWEEYRAEHTDG